MTRDALFKLFWTMLNAALAAGVVWAGDLPPAWGAVALAVFQVASSWVRDRIAESRPSPSDPFPTPNGGV